MVCKKTETHIEVQKDCIANGDRYECTECGANVIFTELNHYDFPNAEKKLKELGEEYHDMKGRL